MKRNAIKSSLRTSAPSIQNPRNQKLSSSKALNFQHNSFSVAMVVDKVISWLFCTALLNSRQSVVKRHGWLNPSQTIVINSEDIIFGNHRGIPSDFRNPIYCAGTTA
jgi:hypothetical protein